MTLITSIIVVAALSVLVVIFTYLLYIIKVLKNRKTQEYIQSLKKIESNPIIQKDLPEVTIMVPTYNEEAGISRKLHDLSKLDYPIEKVDVLIVDDCSTDRTREVAESIFRKFNQRGNIIKNARRLGPNASYNNGVANAKGQLILRTDADTIVKADALLRAVRVISNLNNVAGVTGTMIPVASSTTGAASVENDYRSIFGKMSTAESALHSTFVSGGGFVLIRKVAFSQIPVDLGSTDANISLSFVRKGFRFLYLPETFSYEPISTKMGEQLRQKVRRAARLIQSTILNKDFFLNSKYGEFGKTIFPLRFLMLLVCPLLTSIAFLSTFCLFFLLSTTFFVVSLIAVCLLLLLGTKTRMLRLSVLVSWVFQQFYLIAGLFFATKKMNVWKGVNRVAK